MRPSTRLMIAAAVTGLTTPALGATAPFTETFDGGVYTVETPTFEGGASTTVSAILENDALTVASVGDFNTIRQSLSLEVPAAAATPGRSVTQSVDFTIIGGFTGVSRLGFVFGVTDPETAGQGPSDAVYAYISEPSGDFADTSFRTLAFDESGAQIDISNLDDPERFVPFLAENTAYTLTSTVDFQLNGDITVSMNLVDVATGGTAYDSGDYSFDILAELPPEGEDPLTVDGAWYGLYFRNFESPTSEIVFDNWTLTTATLSAGIVGDYDDSGQVEQGDLNLVLNNWGTAAPFDPNGDPFETTNVDQEELNRVLNNWGSTTAPSFEGAAVPEPGSLALLAGLAALSRRRRA
ncbi:MAG: PEP-CTERM sorting domain-containing protein [Planctomycetota bacterium]